MKFNDYFRLSKISLSSRKQTSRSTVRGISFGMILLIPVIFLSLGLYGDLNKKINKSPELLYADLSVTAERSGVEDSSLVNYNPIISSKHAENLINKLSSTETIYYEQIYSYINKDFVSLNSENQFNDYRNIFSYKIDDTDYTDVYFSRNNNNNQTPFAAILNKEKVNNFFPNKVKSKFDTVYLDNYNQGFTGDGKGQVVLSEQFIDMLGLKAEDVYKKTFSLSYEDNMSSSYYFNNTNIYIDNDSNSNNNSFSDTNYDDTKNVNLCNEYEVVGIIKNEVTKYAQTAFKNSNYYPSTYIMANMMFFSDASLFLSGGDTLEPEISELISDDEERSSNKYVATYTNSDFNNLNKEYMCLGANCFNTFNNYGIYCPTKRLFFDTKTYDELDDVISEITKEVGFLYNDSSEIQMSYVFGSEFYSSVKIVYIVFSYIILFLSIMGGIIFFSAMVNLFNSIVHSIDTRKNYLGIMRAIGAKNNTIPKLYLAESLTLFKRSFFWIVIFSGLICTGIKIGLDSIFEYVNNSGSFPYPISISAVYIPIAILTGLFVLFALGALFSYGCSRTVAKSPITRVLGDA